LKKDLEIPKPARDFMTLDDINMWQGRNSSSLPHTDSRENFLCMIKGFKDLALTSPVQRKYLYAGSEGHPPNYSPVNYYKPDYEKYPMFRNAQVYYVRVNEGDCFYNPTYWWHHVKTPNDSIGLSFWFESHSAFADSLYHALEDKIMT
jgi:hypothetical protein